MSSVRAIRETLVAVARRHSRVAHEVEDLAHDLIVSALRRGTSLDTLLRTAHGAARRHGAFLARSAARRRAREVAARLDRPPAIGTEHDRAAAPPWAELSSALRTTLSLLLAGLDKAELGYVLGVSDPALRKRFQALRQAGPLPRPPRPRPTAAPTPQLRRSHLALLPRLGQASADRIPIGRVLAIGDPDGHGLIFAEVLTSGRATATAGASASNQRRLAKGTSC